MEILDKYDDRQIEALAAYIRERIKEDEYLANQVTNATTDMKGCMDYVTSCAKTMSHGKNMVMVEDTLVYSWAVHYILENGQVKKGELPAEPVDTPKPQIIRKKVSVKLEKKEDPQMAFDFGA